MKININTKYLIEYYSNSGVKPHIKISNAYLKQDRHFVFFSAIKLNHKSKIVKPVKENDFTYTFEIPLNRYGKWTLEIYEEETLKSSQTIEVE
jgi:hypothetical protein